MARASAWAPSSAGANPGPASYRRGGPLTVTDCNVMVGKIDPALFPAVFGAGGDLPLDADIVRERFDALAADVTDADRPAAAPEEVAEGFLQIAVDNMAHAIKHISVERGYDVTEYTLCCFGGAGGQHACAVADALGMTRVFIHPLAGVLSAYGMGLADVRALRQHAVEAVLDVAALVDVEPLFATLAHAARTEVEAQGIRAPMIELQRTVHLKYDGTDTTLEIPYVQPPDSPPDAATIVALVAEFERRYRAAVRIPDAGQAAGDRGGRGRGGRRRGEPRRGRPGIRAARRRVDAGEARPDLHRGRVARGARLPARCLAAGRCHRRPRGHRRKKRDDGGRARLEGDAERSRPSRARARRGACACARDRHHRRPGVAGGLQQPVHGDRRADGRHARQHRLFGQHQGAARLLLRAVRRGGQPDRQRAAHAGAPGLDGRERQDDHRRPLGHDAARRRVRAQCAVQRRYASARRHRHRAGIPRTPHLGSLSR